MTQPKKTPPESPQRRNLLAKLLAVFGGLAGLEIVWILSDFFAPRDERRHSSAAGDIVTAGHIKDFEIGSVTPFPNGKFYLARLDNGAFLALSRSCTHLGCTVPWDKKSRRFVCPCHTSSFNIKGEVLNAPAPRPLDTFAVRIENSIVKVDISTAMKRSSLSPDQAVLP